MRQLSIVVAAAVLLAGCWPARYVDRPGVSGAVVSSTSHAPIAGVHVELTTPRVDREPPYAVLTDENGAFAIEVRHSWGFYSPLGEGFPVTGTIEFAAPGYAPRARQVSWPQTGRAAQDVGIVELEPAR